MEKPISNLIRGVLLVASSLTVLAGAILAPSLPAIQAYFQDVPNVELLARLVLTMPALMIGVVGLFAGVLVDRFGRKNVMATGMVLYVLAGTSGLYLDNMYALLVFRAFMGIAVAGIMTSATTLIGDYFEGSARQKFLGYQAAFMAFGGTAFVTLGGVLANESWRYPFGLYFIALILLPVAMYALVEPNRAAVGRSEQNVEGSPSDESGEAGDLAESGSGVQSMGKSAGASEGRSGPGNEQRERNLERGGERNTEKSEHESERRTEKSAGGGTQSGQQKPREHYSKTALAMVYTLGILGMLLYYFIPVQIPFLLKQLAQASETEVGFSIAAATGTSAIFSINYRLIRSKLNYTAIYSLICFLIGTGYLIISFAESAPLVVTGLVVAGAGAGMLIPNSSLCVIDNAPVRLRGRFIGGMMAMFFLGQFFSPFAAAPLKEANGLSFAFRIGAFFLFGLTVALIILNYFWTRNGRKSRGQNSPSPR